MVLREPLSHLLVRIPYTCGDVRAASLFSGGFMSVQSVRRAKRYAQKVEREFCNPKSEIRCLRGGIKAARDVDLYLNAVNCLREVVFEMATKQARDTKTNHVFKGFINRVLTSDEKDSFKVWSCDDHDLWLVLQTDIQQGYKVSVSYNEQNDTFNATYMCNDEKSPNYGWCLTAFAPEWYTAIRSLVFKHNEILQCEWPVGKQANSERWG